MSLAVQLIETEPELLALAPEWRHLFHAVGSELPFATFEWMSLWWKHLRDHNSRTSDRLQVRTFRNSDGELIAIAPMILTTRISVGPVKMRYLQFFGADNNITEARGVLVLPQYAADVYGMLLQEARATDCEWIRWSGLREAEGATDLIRRIDHPLPDVTHHLLPLPATWEEFRKGLKRNIKESLRKCYNSLERDQHSFCLRVVREPAEIVPSLERFYVLHRARAAVDTTIKHPDVFFRDYMRVFLTEICLSLAASGITRIFELEVDGIVVASRIGFQFENSLYLYYSGYDLEWAKYSVMTTNVAETIQYAIREGLKLVHLSTGTDVGKTRWGTQPVDYREGIQLIERPTSPLIYSVYAVLSRAQHSDDRFGTMLRRLSRHYRG